MAQKRILPDSSEFAEIGQLSFKVDDPNNDDAWKYAGQQQDPSKAVFTPEMQEIVRKLASRLDFYRFIKMAWPYADQGAEFREFWHQKIIAEHLEAFAKREIKHLVICLPPGIGKPLHVDTLVLMGDGTRKRLGDIRVGDYVIGKSGLPGKVLAVHDQGLQDCVKIRTHSGREVISATDHPFLTPDGWVEAGRLTVGQPLALLPSVNINPKSKRAGVEARLAGYFIGDGCVRARGSSIAAEITPADEEYIKDIVYCCEQLGFTARIATSRKNKKTGVVTRVIKIRSGVRDWLRDIGIAGASSRTKKVPDFLLTSSNVVVSEFIASYFHCDGSCYKKGRDRSHHVIEFGSVSERLLSATQHLMGRMGIFSTLRKRIHNNLKRLPPGYVSYRLSIHNEGHSAKFAKCIPVTGPKRRQLLEHSFHRTQFDQNYIPDPILEIEPIGKHHCRCLTVDEEESFTANDFVVHNSIVCSVMFPVWVWTYNPSAKFLCASYREEIAHSFSRWARNIIRTDWYEDYWRIYDQEHGGTTKIRPDADKALNYENTRGGWRMSVVVGGGFASHPNFIIIDDPYNPKEAASERERRQVENWYFETIITRGAALNAGHLINQQRLHPEDLPGLVKNFPDYTFLVLPMEYDPKIVMQMPGTTPDPRKELGELICPDMISKEELEALRRMPAHTYAGQFQQQPRASGGEMFKREWFTDNIVDKLPPVEKIVASCRFWDKAYSDTSRSDYTCGVLMLYDGEYYYVADVVRFRAKPHDRDARIRQVAENDASHWPRYVVAMEEESGAGKQSAEMSVRSLAGFRVRLRKPPEGKPKPGEEDPRVWESYIIQLGMGNIKFLRASWNDILIKEAIDAPGGTHDDTIDATAGAFRELAIHSQRRRVTRPLLLLNSKERNLLKRQEKERQRAVPVDPIKEALEDVATINDMSGRWVDKYW